jgi:peptide/nickel transport system ATP-binding protein
MRANDVSIVHQDPNAALNPSIKVGKQVAEVFAVRGAGKAEAFERAEEGLRRVQIADPSSVMQRYPHQLSGGMQQRVVIAIALAKDPSLLILDEPTTGLDATVQAEVLELITGLQLELQTAALFISHNLSLIGKMCQRVGVLYAGRLVEEGPPEVVLGQPRHPYTVGLLRSIPRRGMRKDHGVLDTIPGFLPSLGEDPPGCVFSDRCGLVEDRCRTEEPVLREVAPGHTSRCHFYERAELLPRAEPAEQRHGTRIDRTKPPLMRVVDLGKVFPQREHSVRALEGVSLEVWPGETLGLVGESGSGKTTLARAILGLVKPTGGTVDLAERPLAAGFGKRTSEQVRSIQIIYQNPDSALNRRHTVRRILRRSLKKLAGIKGSPADERLRNLMHSVRLAERYLLSRPNQLSGGLKQRVAIARAFAGTPRLVVCDEPTSALDVSVQAAILNLLVDLQQERDVAYLFISHDLGVVRFISDRIAVLYLGRLMELGPAEVVFDGPHHPYTEALLSAVPSLDDAGRQRIKLEGEIPSAANPPSGCVFQTRCPRKLGAICELEEPPMVEVAPSHSMRCHIPIDELRRLQREMEEVT